MLHQISLKSIAALSLVASVALTVPAQFDSGSNEEDGVLNVATDMTLPVQEDGVHNYTTIDVADGATLRFSPNSLNTPVIFLASGDVTIEGTIDLSGQNGRPFASTLPGSPGSETQPGPGGYPGGIGGSAIVGEVTLGTPGGGPGGGEVATTDALPNGTGAGGNGGSHFTPGGIGVANPNPAAPTYGDPHLFTLTGGSGGAGGNLFVTVDTALDGPGGGAGGGAILIASSGIITVNGSIDADGGTALFGLGGAGGGSRGGGGGAGGAVRLMANRISGTGSVSALGGIGDGDGGDGLIRFESPRLTGDLESNSNPDPLVQSYTGPIGLDPADIPTIQITAINGTPVSQPPGQTPVMPDVLIPPTDFPPYDVDIATTNVPDGAVVNLRTITSSGDTLLGTSAPVMSELTTATISPEVGTGVIYATVDFNP